MFTPNTRRQTSSVGIPDRGECERSGALVDVGEGPDLFYQEAGFFTEVVDGTRVETTRVAAIGAWSPAQVYRRPSVFNQGPDLFEGDPSFLGEVGATNCPLPFKPSAVRFRERCHSLPHPPETHTSPY